MAYLKLPVPVPLEQKGYSATADPSGSEHFQIRVHSQTVLPVLTVGFVGLAHSHIVPLVAELVVVSAPTTVRYRYRSANDAVFDH